MFYSRTCLAVGHVLQEDMFDVRTCLTGVEGTCLMGGHVLQEGMLNHCAYLTGGYV